MVAEQIVTVTQAGTVTQPGPCTYVVSPTSVTIGVSGGTGSVTVTTDSACSWTATSSQTWLTITQGATGSGNGTVTYSAILNSSGASRSATLTVGGRAVFVTQAGCNVGVTPTSVSLGVAGGSGTVGVTADSACSWTATSNVTWLTIAQGASGSGNGTVAFSAAANSGDFLRSGALSVGGRTVLITQAGCNRNVTPTSLSVGVSGGTASVGVTADSACSWTATSNLTWLTITQGSSGSGNGSVAVSASANTGDFTRSGILSVAGRSVLVSQGGCNRNVTPTLVDVAAPGGTHTVNVTAEGGCSWTATSNVSWLTITQGATGSGNGAVTFSVSANPGPGSRFAVVTAAGRSVSVRQAAP